MSNLFNNFTNLENDPRLTRNLETLLTERDNYTGCNVLSCSVPEMKYPDKITSKVPEFNYYRRLNEDNKIGNLFFNSKNIDNIQKAIRRTIFEKSNNQYKISNQNVLLLLKIMRLVYAEYGTAELHTRNITEQIRFLNNKTIDYAVRDILLNIDNFYYYLDNLKNIEKYVNQPNPKYISPTGEKTLIYKPNITSSSSIKQI